MQLGRGYQLLLTEGAGARNVDVHVNVIEVDSGPGPYHYHERAENVYVVLSGTIEVIADGVRHILREGDAAFIPPGLPHAAGNAGAVEARVLEIYAPPRNGDYHVVDDPASVIDASAPGGRTG